MGAENICDRALVRSAVRSYEMTEFEFRDDGPTGVTFEGVASVVDTPYTVRDQWGTFTETITVGAFNKTLRDSKADVALYVNHDTRALPLASRFADGDNGRLELSADPNLRVVAHLNPARPSVQEVRHAVADGQARQMSIGFQVPKDAKKDVWNDDFTDRQIRELMLHETSIVWKGASPTTSGAIRTLDEWLESLTDVEMDEAELRRAIATFEARLPEVPVEPEPVVNLFAERDRADRERLDHKIAARPGIPV